MWKKFNIWEIGGMNYYFHGLLCYTIISNKKLINVIIAHKNNPYIKKALISSDFLGNLLLSLKYRYNPYGGNIAIKIFKSNEALSSILLYTFFLFNKWFMILYKRIIIIKE